MRDPCRSPRPSRRRNRRSFLRLWKGRPVAVHYSTGIRHATAPESPRHRALKERIAQAAEHAGFSADLEACAPDGRRRTDVLVHGENGLELGCEVQLSYTTAQAVVKRSDIARSDGLSPLWTTDDKSAPLIERAPWARIDHLPLEAFSGGNPLLVRGGVKDLHLKKCDSRNPLPCPDRGYGRCNRWHGTWAPTLGMQLDRLIAATAAQEYVPLYVPAQRGRRASHLWVTARHRDQYLDATNDDLAEPQPGNVDDQDHAEPARLPLSRACSYQQRQEENEERGSLPRDTGAILPAGITLAQPPPAAPPPARHTPLPAQPTPAPASRPGPTVPTPPRQRCQPATAAPHRPPPAPRPAPRAEQDRLTAAARLGCAVDQVGPCASCQKLTHRYGPGGNPLCSTCRERPAS